LLAPDVVLPTSRVERWKKILKLDNKYANVFRQKIRAKNIDPALVPEIISLLCRDANERAAHINVAMPKNPTEETVREALRIADIQDDDPTVRTFLLLAESLPDPESMTTTSESTPQDNQPPTEKNENN
jgi:hypothetical protein